MQYEGFYEAHGRELARLLRDQCPTPVRALDYLENTPLDDVCKALQNSDLWTIFEAFAIYGENAHIAVGIINAACRDLERAQQQANRNAKQA